MKKILILMFSVILIFSLSACTEKQPTNQNSENQKTDSITSNTETNKENLYSGREMYEEIIAAFIEIDDELSRGWFDKDAQNFVKLIKGDNVPTDATATDLIKMYRGFDDTIQHTKYSIRDFFTVTDSYDSTNAGLYNFLEAIDQLESKKLNGKDVVTINSNGNVTGWDFDIVGGDEVIADALGVSVEFIDIMMHTASDAGFTVTFD